MTLKLESMSPESTVKTRQWPLIRVKRHLRTMAAWEEIFKDEDDSRIDDIVQLIVDGTNLTEEQARNVGPRDLRPLIVAIHAENFPPAPVKK